MLSGAERLSRGGSTTIPIQDWTAELPFPVRNMLRRWRGLVGVMIGVGIALGVTMTVLGVARASVAYYTVEFRHSGADLYVVTQGGKLIPELPSDTPGTIKHARNTLSQIRALPDVQGALGVMTWSLLRDREGPKRSDQPAELIVSLGVEGDPAQIPNSLTMTEGRWMRRTDEIVLGPRLSRDKSLHVGDSLRLGGREFSIVGIGKLRGLGVGFAADSIAYLDYRVLRERGEIGDVMNLIAVDARDSAAARERIQEMESLSVFDPAQLIAQAEQVNTSTMVMSWILILLTLAIAGLFITTMLSHAVSERRIEFATLRAIGIPSRTILMTVGAEAVLVNAVGATIGTAISLLLGAWINAWGNSAYGIESLYIADAWLLGLMFALAIGLGAVSGLLPARQAIRVDPVEVLREA